MSIVLLVYMYIVSNLTEKSTPIILKERMSGTCETSVEHSNSNLVILLNNNYIYQILY